MRICQRVIVFDGRRAVPSCTRSADSAVWQGRLCKLCERLQLHFTTFNQNALPKSILMTSNIGKIDHETLVVGNVLKADELR